MDTESTYALTAESLTDGNAASREVLRGAHFTARDLALCSGEEARALITYSDASELRVLPLSIARTGRSVRLHLAAEDDSLETEGRCQYVSGLAVFITKVPLDLLTEAIELAYLGSEERLARHVEKLRHAETTESKASIDEITPQGDAASFLQAILEFAAIRGASDLHLVPQRHGAIIRLRINGELLTQEHRPYALQFHEQVVSRLKVLAGANITLRAVPHDGAFSFSVGTSRRSARLSTLPVLHGESVVIRILGSSEVARISDLGFEPAAFSLLKEMLSCPEGLVLLTGPTGSGKTTTLYGVVRELEARGRNVVAVEDPVETAIPGVVQVQVNGDLGLDYPRAIRAVLRHDPDALLIGEIRDGVSGSMAVDAATTGHLTVSSLHVGSVFDVVRRLEIMGVPRGRVTPALRLILNQRLIPRLCFGCDRSPRTSRRSEAETESGDKACTECRGTGYAGHVLVTEALDTRSSASQDILLRAETVADVVSKICSSSYIPWDEALQYHMSRGAISLAQVEEFYGRRYQ